MNKSRQILAVTLLATVLCADRASVAAVQTRQSADQMNGGIARQLVNRLTLNLRRAVARVRVHQRRLESRAEQCPTPAITIIAPASCRYCLCPFQFRLPPPISGCQV